MGFKRKSNSVDIDKKGGENGNERNIREKNNITIVKMAVRIRKDNLKLISIF